MNKIKRWIENIIKKQVDKILRPEKERLKIEIEKVKELLKVFETGCDLHMKTDSLIIMLRRDKPQVRFWGVRNRNLNELISYLSQLHERNIIIDAPSVIRKLIEKDLMRRR